MSSFKKFAWSGSAVVLALVLAMGLMVQTASAATVTTVGTNAAIALTSNATNGTGTGTVLGTQPVITTAGAAEFGAGSTITLTAPAGWRFTAVGTTTGSVTAGLLGVGVLSNNNTVITLTATAANAAAETITWAALAVVPISTTTATGSVTVTGTGFAAATTFATLTAGAGFTLPYVLTLTAGNTTLPADGSQSTNLTAALRDSAGAIVTNTPINWSSSVGIIGTGSSKTALSTTGATNGNATQSTYRCVSGSAATDTLIVSNTTLSVVGTLSITCVTASGTTAAKIAFNSPTQLAVAANVTNTSPNYQSPLTGTNVSVKVTDAAGLGVNNQVVLVNTAKGYVQAGFGQACPGTTKAVTGTTASLAPSVGATVEAGIVQLTFCGNQDDAPGMATLTAQNISTTMANGTVAISMAGRPAKIAPTVTGTAITAKVTDAGDNPVADGTPIRFTVSANAGAVSTACTTSSNGQAATVVALIAASGTVIVSADYNETGAAATCAAAGTQQVAVSVGVPSGAVTGPGTGGTAGPGTAQSNTIPTTGGLGFIVFNGGTLAQLVTASGCPASTMALYFTVAGEFISYIPAAPAVVNAAVMANFPGGNVPAGTAALGKCM